MPVPDFLCVGASRAGTTSLHDILRQHPHIYLPPMKESHFFDIDANYQKGAEWYRGVIFKDRREEELAGEITPAYMLYDFVPQRIHATLGDAVKLLFLLRNPAERAISHYRMNVGRGIEDMSFVDAVAAERTRIARSVLDKRRYSYISTGYYCAQIEKFLQFFPRRNMFFVLFEDDFLNNRQATLNKMMAFLGLPGHNFELDIRSNVAGENRFGSLTRLLYSDLKIKKAIRNFLPSYELRARLRRLLMRLNHGPSRQPDALLAAALPDPRLIYREHFADQKEKLEQIIGRSLSIWDTNKYAAGKLI